MAPTIVGAASLAVWSAVAVRCLWLDAMPRSVRAGALVAVYAACLGGLVASLGFWGALDTHDSALVGAAWRAAVLVAGLYALKGAASATGGRAR